MRVVLLITMFLVCGCGSDTIPYTDTTKEGYRVNIPESVYEHGLYLFSDTLTEREEIRAALIQWVDSRVDEWIIEHPEYPVEHLIEVANHYVYVVIDDFGIPSHLYSNGLCTGTIDYDEDVISAAIYDHYFGDYLPVYNFAPHTIRTDKEMQEWLNNTSWPDGIYHAGLLKLTVGLHSIPHELDHAIGIDHPYL